jgi:hypothetical protein
MAVLAASMLGGDGVEKLFFELIPSVGTFHTSGADHGVSAAGGPAHARSFEAVFPKMATSPA